jgi:hypothetical protein
LKHSSLKLIPICHGKKIFARRLPTITVAPGLDIPVASLGLAKRGEDLDGMDLVEIQTTRLLGRWTDEKRYWFLCPRDPDWYAEALKGHAFPLAPLIEGGRLLTAPDLAFSWLGSDNHTVEHLCVNINRSDGRTLIVGTSSTPLLCVRSTDRERYKGLTETYDPQRSPLIQAG